MTIARSIQKRMRSLEESGYGYCGVLDELDAASELYVIELEGVRLAVRRDGLVIQGSGLDRFLWFSEILEMISYLTPELCSKASANCRVNFFIPLKIKLEREELSLSIPFLAYSRLLNVLSDMRLRLRGTL